MPGREFLRFFLALDRRHRKLAADALIGLPRLQRRIRNDGLRTTLAEAPPRDPTAIQAERDALIGYGSVVNRVAGTRFVQATCLTRSVFLQRWLQARNVDCTLRIGVRLEDSGFAAHAWVEADFHPINDTAETVGRYQPIADLDAADPRLFAVADRL